MADVADHVGRTDTFAPATAPCDGRAVEGDHYSDPDESSCSSSHPGVLADDEREFATVEGVVTEVVVRGSLSSDTTSRKFSVVVPAPSLAHESPRHLR